MIPFSKFTILGIMSGTSLDGLDLALCEFWKEEDSFQYKIINTKLFPYSPIFVENLKKIYYGAALFFCQMEVEFSNFVVQCVNLFLRETEIKPDYLAFHGHTVFHQPEKGLTKQMGSGAILSAKTGISTICDFRTTDVALGGQGAPLVPVGDTLLFSQFSGCLNLGGIANISKYNDENLMAFDISLCNIPLNYLAAHVGLPYDKEGILARKGKVDTTLLEALNKPEYFNLSRCHKSIGYEFFDDYYKPLLDNYQISVEDRLRTMCEHIAQQISMHLNGLPTVLVTGGGTKNNFLISLVKEKTDAKIVVPDIQLIDFKESLIFAFLGYLRVHEVNNCYKSVTGALRDSCSGVIFLAQR